MMHFRTDVDQGPDVSMVSVLRHHKVLLPGVGPGQAYGEVVGLTAGVGEVTDIEGLREGVDQLGDVLGQDVRAEALGGDQTGHLIVASSDHLGVAVANMRSSIHRVQVLDLRTVVDVLLAGSRDVERVPGPAAGQWQLVEAAAIGLLGVDLGPIGGQDVETLHVGLVLTVSLGDQQLQLPVHLVLG